MKHTDQPSAPEAPSNGLQHPVLSAMFPEVRKAPKVPRSGRKASTASPLPTPSTGTFSLIGLDGRLCVSVALQGVLGCGKRMVVDAADWDRVTATLGTRWGLREVKAGYLYVVGLGAASGVNLARVIARATSGETVAFRNGNRLDLSRGNLERMAAGAFVERAFRGRRAG